MTESKKTAGNKKTAGIDKALLEFSLNKPTIEMDKTIDFTNDKGVHVFYKYASLNAMDKAITPVLAKAGAYYSHKIVETESGGTVETYAIHGETGQRRTSGAMSLGKQMDVKARMGTITTVKRIQLSLLLGVTAEEDSENMFKEKSNEDLFGLMRKRIEDADVKMIDIQIVTLEKNIKALEDKKDPVVGLSIDQSRELLLVANKRKQDLLAEAGAVDVPAEDNAEPA